MIAMRHGFVPAARTMDVSGIMRPANVLRRACVRVAAAYFDAVLVDVVPMHAVEMSPVQVVHMVAVANGLVTATRTVNMGMRFVNGMFVVHRFVTTSLPDPRPQRKRRTGRTGRCTI